MTVPRLVLRCQPASPDRPIPEPPIEPVRIAMTWCDGRNLARRLAALAPAESGEEDLDHLYASLHQ